MSDFACCDGCDGAGKHLETGVACVWCNGTGRVGLSEADRAALKDSLKDTARKPAQLSFMAPRRKGDA